MSTNVPALTIGPTGPVIPDASAILAGRQADLQAAFGGDLAPALTTPQGQLASSDSAIVNDAYATFAAIVAGIDPASSSGRLQDGIARLYFLSRDAANSTVVVLRCFGLTGTPIPINAKAKDRAGKIYLCTEAGTISSIGYVDLTFACAVTGPIAAPAGYVADIYQAIPGWDSCENLADGVPGNVVESPADFEYRRAQSVAKNSIGQTGAVLGEVLAVDGVLDAYALENPLGVVGGADFTGSISGNVLDVSAISEGTIEQGQMLLGAIEGTVVTGVLSGSGATGTYTVSIPQTLGSGALSSAPGGVRLVRNSIYVAAFGGSAQDIAEAIFRKKNPGCSYNGSTVVNVEDTNPAYTAPYPTYAVKFQVPTPTPVKFSVAMQNNSAIPSDAPAQIQAAILAAFTGTDGSKKARIAGPIFASRFYAGIAKLGAWALIYKILVGIDAATQDSILMRADQIPTLAAGDITITFA